MFGATSTTEDVLAGVNLRGKRILVTGVSAGLGAGRSSRFALIWNVSRIRAQIAPE